MADPALAAQMLLAALLQGARRPPGPMTPAALELVSAICSG